MKSAHLSMDALDGAIARLPDSGLAPLRSAALAHLREHGLPTTRDEDWKYTDLTPLVNISNQWLDRGDDVTQQADTSGITSSIQQSIDADWLMIQDWEMNGHERRWTMSDLVVVRGEFKGTKMVYFYKSQEDADKAAAGERVFPALSFGVRKGEIILNYLDDIVEFVSDEGNMPVDFAETLSEVVLKLTGSE